MTTSISQASRKTVNRDCKSPPWTAESRGGNKPPPQRETKPRKCRADKKTNEKGKEEKKKLSQYLNWRVCLHLTSWWTGATRGTGGVGEESGVGGDRMQEVRREVGERWRRSYSPSFISSIRILICVFVVRENYSGPWFFVCLFFPRSVSHFEKISSRYLQYVMKYTGNG